MRASAPAAASSETTMPRWCMLWRPWHDPAFHRHGTGASVATARQRFHQAVLGCAGRGAPGDDARTDIGPPDVSAQTLLPLRLGSRGGVGGAVGAGRALFAVPNSRPRPRPPALGPAP